MHGRTTSDVKWVTRRTSREEDNRVNHNFHFAVLRKCLQHTCTECLYVEYLKSLFPTVDFLDEVRCTLYARPVSVHCHYRIVICLTIEAFAPEDPWPVTPAEPGFFSNNFQNLRLSSAAVSEWLAFILHLDMFHV